MKKTLKKYTAPKVQTKKLKGLYFLRGNVEDFLIQDHLLATYSTYLPLVLSKCGSSFT